MKLQFLKHWGAYLLAVILLLIILLNLKPGFLVLGNDNFSPELHPGLTLERSIFSPAWRTHRVLGIPSDSEQADIFRTSIFWIAERILPIWVVSQGYLFFTFFIASFSMGQIVGKFTHKIFGERFVQMGILLGGVFYMANMLTSWIYFFPVHLFVAAYAFIPFVIWRCMCLFEKRSFYNLALLLLASLLLSTAALTATMFIMAAAIIGVLVFLIVLTTQGKKYAIQTAFLALGIIFGIQLYWALPFLTYVKTNTAPLRDSAINREITTTTIENEARYNTALNTFRYYSSWMDTKEDNQHYSFMYRDWYKKAFPALLLSLLPAFLACIGMIYLFKRGPKSYLLLVGTALIGWFLIKGINFPLGFVFSFFQDTFPIAAQVLRWQSSKLWPLLALTMPILATCGILWVYQKISSVRSFVNDQIPESQDEGAAGSAIDNRRPRWSLLQSYRSNRLGNVVIGVLILCLLAFVYPYFTGHLVRAKVFVKMPGEYQALSQYLYSHDKYSRIYVAPEANTLYFRNYSWGFWGSVVLNYIVPNPIIEKALVIGSYEGEQAFTVVTNSYYSEKPHAFITSLKHYHTPFVLLDGYAATGEVGYAYDPDIIRKQIVQNAAFEKVWEQGKLSLYKIKDYSQTTEGISISPQHDFTKLNTILANSAVTNTDYFSSEKEAGILFPFALTYDALEFTNNEIIAKTRYSGVAGTYSYYFTADNLINSPTKVQYDLLTKEIRMSPLVPKVTVGKKTMQLSLPEKRFKTKNSIGMLSLRDQVVDIRFGGEFKTTSIPYRSIEAGDVSFRAWPAISEPIDLLVATKSGASQFFCNNDTKLQGFQAVGGKRTKCGSPAIPLDSDTIIEASVRVRTSSPTIALLCVESQQRKTCLNKNVSMTVNGIGEATTLIPYVFAKGDSIKVYLDFEPQKNTTVSVEKLTLQTYQTFEEPVRIADNVATVSAADTFALQKGDLVTLRIPILSGPNNAPLQSDGVLIPEASLNPFEQGTPFAGSITISPEKGIQIINHESNSSLFPKLNFVDPQAGDLGMLALVGVNTSGIPVELSLRDVAKPYRLFSRRLWSKISTKSLDIMALPEAVRSYYVEAFSTGLGPRSSINTLQAVVFQLIPQSWSMMQLVPETNMTKQLTQLHPTSVRDTNAYAGKTTGNTQQIYTLDTAISPNWVSKVSAGKSESVLVNGWEQGFITDTSGTISVSFWPNRLVYVGYGILGLIVMGVGAWGLLRLIRR